MAFTTPMMCKPIDAVPEDPARWTMEIKYDGWRAICGVPTNGEPAWLETRTGNRITSVPYIAEELADLLPAGTVIDGEIVSGVGTDLDVAWNRVQTICSRDAIHKPTPEDPALLIVVFDILVVAGMDARGMPLRERREVLETALAEKTARSEGSVHLSVWMPPSEEQLDELIEQGYEGVVCKRLDSVYLAGSRRGDWCKVKPQTMDDDVVCIGTYEATAGSKYDGWAVGGILFRRANGYEGRAAGMDDNLRRDLFSNPDDYVGRVVEIVHHGETIHGALRHPNFKRWRNDRSVADVLGSDNEQPGPDDDQGEEFSPAASAPCRRAKPKPSKRSPHASATVTPDKPRVAPAAPTRASGRRIRNYPAMGAAKLTASRADLRAGFGEHYDKCINEGSGDPAGDLRVVERLCNERGL